MRISNFVKKGSPKADFMKNFFEQATEYAKHIESLLHGVATRTGKSIEDVYLDAKQKSEVEGVGICDILESICAEHDEKAVSS